MDIPLTYSTLINEDGEVVIGDSIVWFYNGYNYFIQKSNLELLKSVKQNPSAYKDKHEVVSTSRSMQKDDDDKKQTNGTIITNDGPNARYQHEWLMNNSSSDRRKTVFEIDGVRAYVGNINGVDTYDFSLVLKVKLEWWWRGHGWQQQAGEGRSARVNVSGLAQPYGFPYAVPASAVWNHPSSPFYVISNYDIEINLVEGRVTGIGDDPASYINYELQGTINCSVQTSNGVLQTASPFSVGPGTLW